MIKTTLCYLEKNESYLMLYRNKKKNDPNGGKWIGVGGKLESGESPEECVIREVLEETDLTIVPIPRGVIYFHSDKWPDEVMYLYSAIHIIGTMKEDCEEGELRWIPKSEIMDLALWEGDRVFLAKLLNGENNIKMSLYYEGDQLVKIESI